MDELERQVNLDEMENCFDNSDFDRPYYPSSEDSDQEFCFASFPKINENCSCLM